jgi:hypothetical protein
MTKPGLNAMSGRKDLRRFAFHTTPHGVADISAEPFDLLGNGVASLLTARRSEQYAGPNPDSHANQKAGGPCQRMMIFAAGGFVETLDTIGGSFIAARCLIGDVLQLIRHSVVDFAPLSRFRQCKSYSKQQSKKLVHCHASGASVSVVPGKQNPSRTD